MSRLDLSKLSIPDAQLVQRGLHAEGYYTGTFLGVPFPKTQAAYDAYRLGNDPAAIVSVTPAGGTPWMKEANRWLGLKEIEGSSHHPQILSWWKTTKQAYRDDETPRCAAYVGGLSRGVWHTEHSQRGHSILRERSSPKSKQERSWEKRWKNSKF